MALAPDDPRHGTYNGYHNHGCRCRPCTDANAAYYREGPARESSERYLDRLGVLTREQWLRLREPKHGTESSYRNRGCRCERCREAAAKARQLRRAETTSGVRQVAAHGKASSYQNGCRCDECRVAYREYNRRRRAAKAGATAAALLLAGIAAAQPAGIQPTEQDLRHGVRVERKLERQALKHRCRPHPTVGSYNRRARDIPADQLERAVRYWNGRRQQARDRSSWCESSVPLWPWRALASCESGRAWTYNGSSGFDGALQFLPSTWNSAKAAVPYARRYAYAWQAPPYWQYRVAESWLARTSWAQWPACSRTIGAR